MNIILVNGDTLEVTRVNHNISTSNGIDQLIISFAKGTTLETVSEKLTSENVSEVTVVRTGYENIVYEGYELQNISEDITPDNTNISAVLVKA